MEDEPSSSPQRRGPALAWGQVGTAHNDAERLVRPLIEQDIEWDRKRSSILAYLLVGYGASTITGFQLLFSNDHMSVQMHQALLASLHLLAIGLAITCVAYMADLTAHWLSMRNRKTILATASYQITTAETITSAVSALLALAAAAIFGIVFISLFFRL